MRRGGARLTRECLLEVFGGRSEIARGQRRAAGSEQRRRRTGIPGERFREQRRRQVGAALRETHLAEPDQRRKVVGPQIEDLFERFHGLLQGTPNPVDVAEVVRPARVGRRQRLGVEQARLGAFEVGRRHEQLAGLAELAREVLSETFFASAVISAVCRACICARAGPCICETSGRLTGLRPRPGLERLAWGPELATDCRRRYEKCNHEDSKTRSKSRTALESSRCFRCLYLKNILQDVAFNGTPA